MKRQSTKPLTVLVSLLFLAFSVDRSPTAAQEIDPHLPFRGTAADMGGLECIYFARANGDDRWHLNFHSANDGLSLVGNRLFIDGGQKGMHGNKSKLLMLDVSEARPIDLQNLPNSVWKKDWTKPPLNQLPVAEVIADGGRVLWVRDQEAYIDVSPWENDSSSSEHNIAAGFYRYKHGRLEALVTGTNRIPLKGGQWHIHGSRIYVLPGQADHDVDEFAPKSGSISHVAKKLHVGSFEEVDRDHDLRGIRPGIRRLNVFTKNPIHAADGLFPALAIDPANRLLKVFAIDATTWQAKKVYEETLTTAHIPMTLPDNFLYHNGSVYIWTTESPENISAPGLTQRGFIREVSLHDGKVVRDIFPPSEYQHFIFGAACFAPDGTIIISGASEFDPITSLSSPTFALFKIKRGQKEPALMQTIPWIPIRMVANEQYVYLAASVPDFLVNMKKKYKTGNLAIYRLALDDNTVNSPTSVEKDLTLPPVEKMQPIR